MTNTTTKTVRIGLPFVVRHVIDEVTSYLKIAGIQQWMALPMNIEIKTTDPDENDEYTAKVEVYYAGGFKVNATVTCRKGGHYGTEYSTQKLTLRWKSREAEEASLKIEVWAGPCETKIAGHESKVITISGKGLLALHCNASWRSNHLPTYEWSDAKHPRHTWQ